MNKVLLTLLLIPAFLLHAQTPCSGGTAGGFPCNGLTLQSQLTIANMGGQSYGSNDPAEAQDSWGWTDPSTQKEYAIIGMNDRTAFVDISDPNNPLFLGHLMSHTNTSWWRDVKVYNNYAYIVSDDNGSHGVQIFDLTKLRNVTNPPVTFTRDGRYSGISYAHNIIINEDTGYLYILGSNRNSGAPRILDLNTNPTNPTVAGNLPSSLGYCHDAQVVIYNGPDPDYQGKELLIGAFSGSNKVHVIDVTDKNNPVLISNITYDYQKYTHQGWFTEDQRFFILGDEEDEAMSPAVDNTRTIVLDLNDLDNPIVHLEHSGPTLAIDHNGYVVGNRFYVANYNAGMRILKVDGLYESTPFLEELDSFDTHPASNSADFHGAWNVYPFFKSGNIIISDLDEGLVIVKDPLFDNEDPVAVCQPYTATLDKNTGSVTITAEDIDGGNSTDNFGIVKKTIEGQTTFTCADVGTTHNITLTVEDDYGNKASCVTVVTVAAEETSYTGIAWTNGAPGKGSFAKIAENYNTSSVGASSIDACMCEVEAGKTLTIEANDYLNVTRDITVNGDLVVAHTGSVVQEDNAALVTNNGSINVNITTPTLNERDFMMMGSPMSGDTNTIFTDVNTGVPSYQVLWHNTDNFTPNPAVAAAMPGAENFSDNGDSDYDWRNYTGAINPGEGYLIRPSYTQGGTYNYTYSNGTLNNGIITYAAGYNGTKNASPNIIANPYASAIDATELINSNAIIDEVYFWEHLTTPNNTIPGPYYNNYSMEDISMFNLGGGVPAANDNGVSTTPTGVIASGQGFGIKANALGTVTFDNSLRSKTGNTTFHRPVAIDRIWLTVREGTYHKGSTALIGFTESASETLDPGYDSKRLATIVSLYSHLQDGSEELGIQTTSSFDPTMSIPMGFSTLVEQDGGELPYVISISNIEGENIENVIVYLEDHLENTVTNLSEGNYEFTSDRETYHNRFTLRFEGAVAGNSESLEDSLRIFPNPTQGTITIQSPESTIQKATVIDIQGRILFEKSYDTEEGVEGKKGNEFRTLDLTGLNAAVYFIQLQTSNGLLTKQVIKE